MSRRDRTTEFVFVRPLLTLSRVLPLLVLALGCIVMGVLGTGPLGVRLLISVVFPLFFVFVAVVGILRTLALARPGLVRPGLGREWVAVSAPQDIAVDETAGRWPQICVFNNPKAPALVTCPGPIWFGSHERHRRALDAARDQLVDAAFPERDGRST